jgi:PPOX class probable F420-dependent enzyme
MSSVREVCSIPAAYRDLLAGRIYAALATVMPDGQPQCTVVWCDYAGTHVLINTMRGFRKEKNMRANPKVTLLAYEQRNPLRSLEVRGTVVEMTEARALAHLDSLSVKYIGRGPYFGACVPAELSAREFPVLCRIMPTRVVTLNAGCAADNVNFSKPPRVVPTDGCLPESHLDLVARPLFCADKASDTDYSLNAVYTPAEGRIQNRPPSGKSRRGIMGNGAKGGIRQGVAGR